MVKSNFFLTAAGLHLGILAFSYWFYRYRNQLADGDEDESEESLSSAQPQPPFTDNRTHDESGAELCSVCFEHLRHESNLIIPLRCGHKVHSSCFNLMKMENMKCPTCGRNSAMRS